MSAFCPGMKYMRTTVEWNLQKGYNNILRNFIEIKTICKVFIKAFKAHDTVKCT